ncbi:MAG: glycosyltransferase family 2 protein [Nanoarchaeota archaeon]|nr:glycosyltransferase family 2 protein [Nanoarchaeota archaeon]MBU1622596.1 glycosyltransferase family 2 protein [Nanoarchaeota archaeon]MBU1974698.1 glycosyltransferase family 2 protein [Nanoarchaeota archaeon]
MKFKCLDEHPVYSVIKQKKIIVVMPAYNAEKTLKDTISRIPKKMIPSLHKIIIVNDGSIDRTEDEIKRLMKEYNHIELVNHEMNRGYGAAQKTGFNIALDKNGEVFVLLHSDGQYAPELLPKMIWPFFNNSNSDVVLGSRILGRGALKGGMPLYKYLGNRFLTLLENIFYNMNISEFHTGYMLYSKKALLKIPFNKLSNTFHFDGEMVMMSGKKRLRITEVPIPTRYAKEKSHLKPIKYGLDVLKIMIKEKMGKYDF